MATGQRHILALDGVRGIAILMVIACHLELVGVAVGTSPISQIVRKTMWMGWSGVDLFFVLSGFLITGILIDKKESSNRVRSFYVRRMLRIAPLYYLALLLLFIIVPFVNEYYPHRPNPMGWASYFLYLQNLWMPVKEPKHDLLGHFWSLAIEEQFYFAWPWLVWRLDRKALLRVCVALIALAFVVRAVMVTQTPPDSAIVLMNPLCRMDTLLMGALCAMIIRSEKAMIAIRGWIPMIGGLAFVVFGAMTVLANELRSRGTLTQTFGFTLLAIAYACFIPWSADNEGARNPISQALSFAPLRSVGRYAYGIYVYHIYVLGFGLIVFKDRAHGWLACLLFAAASYAIAAFSFEFFEKRFIDMKAALERPRPVQIKVEGYK